MSGLEVDPRDEMRTICETTVEEILRDAAELGWKYAQAGGSLAEARTAAVNEAHSSIVGIVGQIMRAGAAVHS